MKFDSDLIEATLERAMHYSPDGGKGKDEELFTSLNLFHTLWESPDTRQFIGSYGRLVGLVKEGTTKTSKGVLFDAYVSFERNGDYLNAVATTHEYDEMLLHVALDGVHTFLKEILPDHQRQVSAAFAHAK